MDITPVMADINALLDRSLIDFETLAKRFATTTRKNIEFDRLRAAVRTQLDTLARIS